MMYWENELSPYIRGKPLIRGKPQGSGPGDLRMPAAAGVSAVRDGPARGHPKGGW